MRRCSEALRSPRMRGFTILEIMIATAILTLGLVGILALFPVAIRSGKQVVETSTAAVVAQSVADAIREGMRNNLRTVTRGNFTSTYFVFKHDGVTSPIPPKKEAERPGDDYYILLPRYRSNTTFASRDAAIRGAKTFLYPETDSSPNGGGDPASADNDGDDWKRPLSGGDSLDSVRVEKTYRMGRFLPDDNAPSGESVLEDQKIDALKQYSYAFTVAPSFWDVSLSPSDQIFMPGNRLYHVKVMVFRAFMPPGPDSAPPDPVFELDFEVSA